MRLVRKEVIWMNKLVSHRRCEKSKEVIQRSYLTVSH